MSEERKVRAVRYRWSCQVLYKDLTEFLDIQREKATISAQRGWVESRFWMTSIGTMNDFFLEREYPDLNALAAELTARENDIDFSKLMRASYSLVVQGSIRTELFEELDIGAMR